MNEPTVYTDQYLLALCNILSNLLIFILWLWELHHDLQTVKPVCIGKSISRALQYLQHSPHTQHSMCMQLAIAVCSSELQRHNNS